MKNSLAIPSVPLFPFGVIHECAKVVPRWQTCHLASLQIDGGQIKKQLKQLRHEDIHDTEPSAKHNPLIKIQTNPVMKTQIYSILAAAAACGMAFGQTTAYTTPVGFVTEPLKGGQFNLLGLTVHTPSISAGVIDAKTTASVTDNEVNFTTLLTVGATYVLELDGGVIQEVTGWSGSTLNTPADISTFVTNGTTKYKLRKAPTVGDLFGPTNSAGLQATPDGDFATADIIYIPNGTGGFKQVFYDNSTPGWVDLLFNDSTNFPIVYTDGVLIQRKGGDKNLTFSGEVKKTPTVLVTESQFTYVGGVYPAGSTLGNSNLSASVQKTPDGDFNTADLIYLPNGLGGYKVAFYDNSTPGWVDLTFNDLTNEPLKSGFIIQRRSATPYNINLTPPSFYPSL